MSTLYIATGDGFARLTQTTPGSDVWDVATALESSGAGCLAVDPFDPHTIYAGSAGEGVWKSRDGGVRWSNMGLPQGYVFSIATGARDRRIYAGCEPSMLFCSLDGGRSWDELEGLRELPSAPSWSFPPRPWTSHVRWIAPCPHDENVILAGIEQGALVRSVDGGQTWEDHRPGALPDVHTLAWHPAVPGRAYEAGGYGGAAWSEDGGDTWKSAGDGLDRPYTWALAVDPIDPDCWFISAAPGPRQAHQPGTNAEARLYRRRGQEPWQALGGGLPQPLDSLPYSLVSAPGQLFTGLGDGRIFMSRDNGDTWAPLQLRGNELKGVRAMIYVNEK